MELNEIVQSPSVQSRRDSADDVGIDQIEEPTKSQEDAFDREVKDQVGARTNSVVEYADPPGVLPGGVDAAIESAMDYLAKGDSDSENDNNIEDKQNETMRRQQDNLKHQSLASSLGQYGEAAVKDMGSIFKKKPKRTPAHVRLPSIPIKQISNQKDPRNQA